MYIEKIELNIISLVSLKVISEWKISSVVRNKKIYEWRDGFKFYILIARWIMKCLKYDVVIVEPLMEINCN